MNEIIQLDRVMSEISAMTKEQLLAEFRASLVASAQQIVRMAAIVRTLEERGDDLSDLPQSSLGLLRRIAHGQMRPELYAEYQSQPMLLQRVARLPLTDQESILKKGSVSVAEFGETGKVVTRNVPLPTLSRDQISLVFGDGVIRNADQQTALLKGTRGRAPRETKDGVVLDSRRGGIVVNGVFLSRKQLAEFLARLED